MKKKYKVLLLEIDEIVEEEVVVFVQGKAVKCFVSYCPFDIEVGKEYAAEFDLDLPDFDCVESAKLPAKQVEILGQGFSCVVSGYLDGTTFRSFVDFNDMELHYDYPKLNETYVSVRVNRINIDFG